MMRTRLGFLAGVTLAVLLAGCVLPPKDSKHAAPLDAQQLGLSAAAVAPAAAKWWQALHDPQLDTLIEQALSANPSLAQADAQLRAAVAQVDAAHAGLYPKASFSGSALRQHAPEQLHHSATACGQRISGWRRSAQACRGTWISGAASAMR